MSSATGWWGASLLVNIDTLPVGSRWREPHGGDKFRKISPYSHRNERTGELLFDSRLYGQTDVEPAYVEEVIA